MAESTHNRTDDQMDALRTLLERVQTRFRLREAVALAPIAVAMAFVAALVVVVAGWLCDTVESGVDALAIAVFVAAALGTVLLYALVRPRDLMQTARSADHLLALDERLATALEAPPNVERGLTTEEVALRGAQLEDAVQMVGRLDLRRELPARVKPVMLVPAGVLLVLAGVALAIPNPFVSATDRALQAQISTDQKKVEELAQAVQAQPRAATDPALQSLLKELSTLSQDLSDKRLSREEALARLSQAQGELEKALDPQAAAEQSAIDQLAKQLSASQNATAQEAGKALQSGDAQKAAQELSKLADESSKLSPQEKAALSQTLQQARDSALTLDPELARQLNEAATSLNGSDPKAAQEALKSLSQQVGDKGSKAATNKELEQALSQIQESKQNVAQAGQPKQSAQGSQSTPEVSGNQTSVAGGNGTQGQSSSTQGTSAGTQAVSTAVAAQGQATKGNGTAVAGTQVSGTQVSGTAVSAGSPVQGQAAQTGTPAAAQGGQGRSQSPTAGQVGGQSQGQGQGQSQQQGQGQGQGEGQGNGQASSSGGSQAAGQGGQGSWGTGHEEPVYAPPSSLGKTAATPVALQGQNNQNGEQSSTTTNNDPNNIGGAQVPYEQVYGQYRQQAGNALNSDYIPQGYKDLVRDYFSDIAPQGQP